MHEKLSVQQTLLPVNLDPHRMILMYACIAIFLKVLA